MEACAGRARIGPTTRVAACCLFAVAVVIGVTPRVEWLAGWTALLLAMAWASGTTPVAVLRRALPALPFVLAVVVFLPFVKPGAERWATSLGPWRIAVTDEGWAAFQLVTAKSLLAVGAMAVIGASTSLPETARALRDLRVPTLLVLVILLTLRYLSLMREEAGTLLRARDLRRFGRRLPGEWASLGHLVGTLFVRTLERADRVHGAMRLRGFAGEYRLLHERAFGVADVAYLVAVAAVATVLGVWPRW